jgi:hypothetical protein
MGFQILICILLASTSQAKNWDNYVYEPQNRPYWYHVVEIYGEVHKQVRKAIRDLIDETRYARTEKAEAFLYGIKNSDNETVLQGIREGMDPNVMQFGRQSALILAVRNLEIDPKVVQMLVKAGAEVEYRDDDGKSALDYAFERDDVYTEKPSGNCGTVSSYTTRDLVEKSDAVVDALLSGVDEIGRGDLERMLIETAVKWYPNAFQRLLAKVDFEVEPERVSYLLEKQVWRYERGMSEMTWEVLKRMKAYGGFGKQEPLLVKSMYVTKGEEDELKVVKLLLEKGADPNQAWIESGRTPVMEASYLSTTKLLVERGADLRAKDQRGQGVFERFGDKAFSRRISYVELGKMVSFYLEKGLSLQEKNGHGDKMLYVVMDGLRYDSLPAVGEMVKVTGLKRGSEDFRAVKERLERYSYNGKLVGELERVVR